MPACIRPTMNKLRNMLRTHCMQRTCGVAALVSRTRLPVPDAPYECLGSPHSCLWCTPWRALITTSRSRGGDKSTTRWALGSGRASGLGFTTCSKLAKPAYMVGRARVPADSIDTRSVSSTQWLRSPCCSTLHRIVERIHCAAKASYSCCQLDEEARASKYSPTLRDAAEAR